MKRTIGLVILTIIFSLSFSAVAVRGGMRSGGITIGMENQPLSFTKWLWGFGGEIVSGGKSNALIYGSFGKIVTAKKQKGYPVIVTMGPIAGLGSNSSFGGFAQVAWMGILNQPRMFFAVGLDLMTKSSGICAEIGYRF